MKEVYFLAFFTTRDLIFHLARLSWRSGLSDASHNGIVYVVDPEQLSQSQKELEGILDDDEIKQPVLVLGPKSEQGLKQLLKLPQTTKVCNSRIVRKLKLKFTDQGGKAVALFTYSLSLKPDGLLEGQLLSKV